MKVTTKGDVFYLRYEPECDKRKPARLRDGFGDFEVLVCMICNSAEMDFVLPGDAYIDFSGVSLWNEKYQKAYHLTHKDVKDFWNGKEIVLS